ncbi:hypothetical protein [Paenimyroides aestuarii]|uniref:Long-chain fatty acid transport protein n=1 Tax=Paenimyroides aestuarii TaxID=2968490 RepID=A0ABY5NS88_9FLAO|nr:hypothetical protein [Paenimyroides aestuarii]UUV21405.1 hypothetical protein NPX36_13930 [Paenimyroides aestuarii]
MIRKIVLGVALASTCHTFAQQGTASPYSYYGFGDQQFKGANEIKSMGSLAVYSDSLHINTLNPASYAKLQTTTFSLGASYKGNNLQNANSKEKTTSGSFDYLALAFPAGDFNVAVGIMPYSFVGYNIQNTNINDNGMTISRQYVGEGGLNRTFLGLSYKISKNFSIGVNGAYIFGDTETSLTKFIADNGEGVAFDRGSRIRNLNNYSGFSITGGFNFEQPLKNKLKLYASATFSPEMQLKNDQTKTLATVRLSTQTGLQEINATTTQNSNEEMLLPMNYSFGAGIGNHLKWFVGAEYTANQTSKYNTFYKYENATYNDYMKIGVGGFYTPKYNSFTSYLERMTYRAGFNYENTGLVINQEEIKGINANIGIGFPVGRYNSNINLGFEYGQKGNTNMGLIKENYYGVNIGLSFNDVWFKRRKFD